MEILQLVRVERPIKELSEFGYSCFADGENGNFWVFRKDAPRDPEVYFLELTAWNGSEPDRDNGLIVPGILLSQLFLYGADWVEPDK